MNEASRHRNSQESFQTTSFNFEDNNNNCLMLKDLTNDRVPSNLAELFKNFQTNTLTIADICFQLVYLVALETGFAELNVYKQCENELYNSFVVTSYYNAQNVECLAKLKPTMERHDNGNYYSVQLCSIFDKTVLDRCLDETDLLILMSAIVSGDFMIVSLTPQQRKRAGNLNCSRSICLSMPRYVINTLTNMQNQNQRTFNDCLRNMEEFTYKLRDQLFVPVRSYHLTLLNVDIYPAMIALPLETYDIIFKHLNECELRILAKVSKQFFELITMDMNLHSATSVRTQNYLPFMMSSFFEVESYYQQDSIL